MTRESDSSSIPEAAQSREKHPRGTELTRTIHDPEAGLIGRVFVRCIVLVMLLVKNKTAIKDEMFPLFSPVSPFLLTKGHQE